MARWYGMREWAQGLLMPTPGRWEFGLWGAREVVQDVVM